MKAFEQVWKFFVGYAGAGVAYDDLCGRCVRVETHFNANLPGERELECVGEQVEDDLLKHVTVDMDVRRQRWTVHPQSQPSLVERGPKGRSKLGSKGRYVHRLVSSLQPSRLNAGEIQQRVDELEQAQRVTMGDANELTPLRTRLVARFGKNFLKRRQHESDRRAELMTDVGKKQGLRVVECR